MPVVTRSKTLADREARKKEFDAAYKAYLEAVSHATPPRVQRNVECPPAPKKPFLDFSRVPKKPVSEPFVFPKSTEEKLADALGEIEKVKKEMSAMTLENDVLKETCKANVKELVDYMNQKMTQTVNLLDENVRLRQNNMVLEKRVDELTDRIRNPFKNAPLRPW